MRAINKFDLYNRVTLSDGTTPKERMTNHCKNNIIYKSRRSPSRKSVLIDSEQKDVVIVSGSNNHVKTICALPNDIIYDGQIVEWEKSHWLISDVDIESSVYYKGVIHQCNINLRWQNKDGEIISRWCYAETNTADGIKEGNTLNLTDGNLTLHLPLDNETRQLRLDRRFLLDIEKDNPTAYKLINRNVVSGIYDENHEHGVYIITLQKSERSHDRDNYELMIADYFKPTEDKSVGINCAIKFDGSPTIKAGGYYKSFNAVFYDKDGSEISQEAIWNVAVIDEHKKYFSIVNEGSTIKIKADNNEGIIGSKIKIELCNSAQNCSAELYVKVVAIL